MVRRLLNLLTGISLLLLAAVCVLWVRSFGAGDAVERHVAQYNLQADWGVADTFFSAGGVILWVHARHPDRYGPPISEVVQWQWFHPGPESPPQLYRVARSVAGIHTDLSFDRDTFVRQWREQGFSVEVPHRSLALAFAIGSAVMSVRALAGRVRRSSRSRRGRCRACGYDLTANASGVCPECGTAR